MSTIVAMLLVVLAFVFIVVRAVIDVHRGKSVTGKEGLMGEEGVVLADFKGSGKIRIHGEIWTAEVDGDVKSGDRVIVEGMKGMVLSARLKK